MMNTIKKNPSTKCDYDYIFKILLMGDSGVGKSSLLLRFTENTYSETFITTIGVDFKIKTIDIDGTIVKLQIWDTAGQERFRTITSSYYRGANAAILVYDITNKRSFENIKKWLYEINTSSASSIKAIKKIIVGNKADLVDNRKISYDDAKIFCDILNIKFIESSAKNSEKINEIFNIITHDLLNDDENNSNKNNVNEIKPSNLNIMNFSGSKVQNSTCCD